MPNDIRFLIILRVTIMLWRCKGRLTEKSLEWPVWVTGIDEPLPIRTDLMCLLLIKDVSIPVSEPRCDVAPVSVYQLASALSVTFKELKAWARSIGWFWDIEGNHCHGGRRVGVEVVWYAVAVAEGGVPRMPYWIDWAGELGMRRWAAELGL